MPSGWLLAIVVSIALLVLNTSLVVWLGWGEESVRTLVRSSARSSVLLFLLSFSAYGLRRFAQSSGAEWLVRNRPFVTVSLAASHALHLAALILLGAFFPAPFLDELDAVTIVGGGLAYVGIVLMAVLSFERPAAGIGAGTARVVDAIASYYVWLVFLNSYLARAREEMAYGVVVAALLLALPLRILGKRPVLRQNVAADVVKT